MYLKNLFQNLILIILVIYFKIFHFQSSDLRLGLNGYPLEKEG